MQLEWFSDKTPTRPHAFHANMIPQAYHIVPLQNQMRFSKFQEVIDGFL